MHLLTDRSMSCIPEVVKIQGMTCKEIGHLSWAVKGLLMGCRAMLVLTWHSARALGRHSSSTSSLGSFPAAAPSMAAHSRRPCTPMPRSVALARAKGRMLLLMAAGSMSGTVDTASRAQQSSTCNR